MGTSASYALAMAVPGGRVVPVAGVTWVSVLPTHRRRGIAGQLLRRQLGRLHELRAGTLAGAARAFAADPLPWCPRTF